MRKQIVAEKPMRQNKSHETFVLRTDEMTLDTTPKKQSAIGSAGAYHVSSIVIQTLKYVFV